MTALQMEKAGTSDQDHLGLLFSEWDEWEVAVMALNLRVAGELQTDLHLSLQVAHPTK